MSTVQTYVVGSKRPRGCRHRSVWLQCLAAVALILATTAMAAPIQAGEFDEPRYSEADITETHWGDGDTVDCIDRYAQPGMRRSEMLGLSIEEPPELTLDVGDVEVAPANGARSSALPGGWPGRPGGWPVRPGEPGIGSAVEVPAPAPICPAGTVPIVRTTESELEASRQLSLGLRESRSQFFSEADSFTALRDGSTDLHQYAAVRRTVANYGAESDMNLWAPYTERSSEFMLSQLWVQRGSGDDLETVEAGWQKFRDIYGDWNTHLFIYFTPDNYGSGGCYNLDCSGFVQIDNAYTIGGTFPSSIRGGAQLYARIAIVKAGATGSWWLKIGETWIGYWPRNLFDSNGLADQAATVTYGGEIINSNSGGQHTRTDMGSGQFANRGFGQAAWQKRLHYVDLNMTQQRASSTFNIVTDPQCYSLSSHSSLDDNWREYFYFGGSGYNTNCR